MGSRGPRPGYYHSPASMAATCSHLNITEVVASGEEEPCAYICLSPECYAQLDLDDAAVKWHLDRADLRASFSAPSLEEKAREVREYSVENAWVQIHPFTDETRDRMRKAVGMPSLAEMERRSLDRKLRREKADELWAELDPNDANDGIPDQTEVVIKRSPRTSW